MSDVFAIPNNFEEATSLWDNLGRNLANAHLQRARLAFAILHENDPSKFGRDWNAEDLGAEWGVTGERIRRYVRCVKVFGSELDQLMALPKVSWTHLEEISRIADPQLRKELLAEVQATRVSANTTRQNVSNLLGEGDGASKPVHLPNFPGGAKKASTQLGENESFRSTMVRLADWFHAASAELRHLRDRVGPHGIYAADGEDQEEASGARNELDDFVEELQLVRTAICISIPPPEPENPGLVQEESIPEISGGRVLDI
jgi:hypothetical protein